MSGASDTILQTCGNSQKTIALQMEMKNITPDFPSKDAREQKEKEIAQALFRIFSKY